MFVKMYGLPSYTEIDPTGILAVTYILFFGIMFGDVGQSLVLAIAGFIALQSQEMGLGRYCRNGRNIWCDIRFIYGSFFEMKK